MVAAPLSNRWAVVAQLQAFRSRYRPGSERFETADHAITLALNPSRDNGSAFLYWDLVSDARRVRSRQPRRVFLSDLSTSTEDDSASDWDVKSDQATPAQLAEASELEASIRGRLAELPHGDACLDGLLSGESPTDTALRLGIAIRRVCYLRKKIRIVAKTLVGEGGIHAAA